MFRNDIKSTLDEDSEAASPTDNFLSEEEHGPMDLLQHNLKEYFDTRKLVGGTKNGVQLVAKKVVKSGVSKAVSEMVNGTMTPSLSSKIQSAANAGKNQTFTHSTSKGKYTIKLYVSGSTYTVSVGK